MKAIAPQPNFLESWGDYNPSEGYYTIIQPTISPIYNTRQAEQSLLVWGGDQTDYYTFVKNNWENNLLTGTSKSWIDVLQTGFVDRGDRTPGSYSFDLSGLTAIAAQVTA